MRKILLLVIFCLLPLRSWAAYPDYTVCASGCDFTTIALAVADIVASHSTPAVPVTITATDASVETAAITISGITLSSTNTLTITSSGAGASNGRLQGYIIKPSSGAGITVNVSHVIVKGLAFDMSTSNGNGIRITNSATNQKSIGNYFKMTSGSGVSFGQVGGSTSYYAYNNICFGNKSGSFNECIDIANSISIGNNTNFYVYNNTCYGMGRCYDCDNGTNATIKIYFSNNYSGNTVNGDIYRPERANTAGTNNFCASASGCTTSPLINGTNNASSYASYFRGHTTGDFRLQNSGLLNAAGTDLSGTFTTDVTNSTRTQWDVGAFLYVPIQTSTIRNATVNNATIN